MTKAQQINAEALQRAQNCHSLQNMARVIAACQERGYQVPAVPGENVLTFRAWLAKGRAVKKGEKGIAVCTFKPVKRRDPATGQETEERIPWTAHVFHVEQTAPATPRTRN